jgi:ABC-type nitrate/sulfonate/bicarbonate transport system substrate-binding protein
MWAAPHPVKAWIDGGRGVAGASRIELKETTATDCGYPLPGRAQARPEEAAVADLVRLGVFSPSIVVGVATAVGTVEQAGHTIEEVPATSSSQQFDALLRGELDAVLTSPDNVLAYRGSAANPLGRVVDVRVLAAVDRGLGLSLFTAPGLTRGADVEPGAGMRGGVLAVDVPTSGFAFVAYELLARQGLRAGLDYEVRAMGTTPRRGAALAAGDCTMTVLNAGADLRAEVAGCTRVARASSLGRYVGTVLAAPGPRVEDSPAQLRALTTVILATSRALLEGRLHDIAARVAADRLGLDSTGVRRYLSTVVDPREGLVADGRLDDESVQTLRWLRARYADAGTESAAVVPPGSGLVDNRFLPPPLS